MNEADVASMSETVLVTPVNPAAEASWRDAATTQFQSQEQQLMAEWKMWKYVRDDERMTTVADQLTRVRACLAFLTARDEGGS